MKIIKNIKILKKEIAGIKKQRLVTGFVPTMGALHEGHLSLMRRARKETDRVVVSIFVNPSQFGPQEDLKKYPRPLKQDLRLAKSVGVDMVFNPSVATMYPSGFQTYIDQTNLPDHLCGSSRAGHFKGVMTVVSKLFNQVQPDSAYFGQKDYQQALIIKRMARDLDMDVKIKILPIVREKDGLAMSSRNSYLSQRERKSASCLYQALGYGKILISGGEKSAKKVIAAMRRMLQKNAKIRIDYIAVVDTETLVNIKYLGRKKVLIACAVFIGKTRLIDNTLVKPR